MCLEKHVQESCKVDVDILLVFHLSGDTGGAFFSPFIPDKLSPPLNFKMKMPQNAI